MIQIFEEFLQLV